MNTVLRRWKKHFEKLINEENNSESRTNKGKMTQQNIYNWVKTHLSCRPHSSLSPSSKILVQL